MSDRENLYGLVLEGISGTGKSTLMEALLRSERYVNRPCLSSMILSEHQTQRILEKKQREEGLEKKDNLNLLDSHVSYLEELGGRLEKMEWCRRGRTVHRIPWLFERFHLTHFLYYGHLDWDDVQPFDHRLARMDGKICLLTAGKDELDDRLFEKRDEFWNSYIQRFGDSRREILGHFTEEQERLLKLTERTVLPVLIMNPSEYPLPKAVGMILDFWFGSGSS